MIKIKVLILGFTERKKVRELRLLRIEFQGGKEKRDTRLESYSKLQPQRAEEIKTPGERRLEKN